MTATTTPITGSYITVFAACTTPAPAGGGPREVRADVVEISYEIGDDGVTETGHKVLHTALMMLTTDGGDAYLDGDTDA